MTSAVVSHEISAAPTSALQLNPDLPPDLHRLIAKALERPRRAMSERVGFARRSEAVEAGPRVRAVDRAGGYPASRTLTCDALAQDDRDDEQRIVGCAGRRAARQTPPGRSDRGRLDIGHCGHRLIYIVLGRCITNSRAGSRTACRDFEITQLTTTGNAITPAISPDGKYVAGVQPEEGTSLDPTVAT